jgi:glycosyltransferase involved in cell wall biosynthesis
MNSSASAPRTVVHLVASPFVGGPERQMIGLARALSGPERSVFLGFPEGSALDERLRGEGFESHLLSASGRPVRQAVAEVVAWLERLSPDVVITHGYKPDLVGLLACRRAGVPHIAVAHGWTGATLRVRVNEAIDKLVMRGARRVVAVSHRQGQRVQAAGVRGDRVVVIQNAIDVSRFRGPDAAVRAEMEAFFPVRPAHLVIAAGRLSPEKGFDDLVRAARLVVDRMPGVGFLLVGDGPLREPLEAAVRENGLEAHVVLAGFRGDLDRLMASADLFVQSSHTEGLPNVVLEAGACSVPIVATAVGGTGEVLEDGRHGRLVPPRRPGELARCIVEVLSDPAAGRRMAAEARRRVEVEFTFPAKAAAYRRMFEECLP